MKRLKAILSPLMVVVLISILASCESSAELDNAGKVQLAVTDAAVDAQNITGVFLSVSEVQAKTETEVKTVASFDTPKTVNLMDYQNGETYTLGEGELAVDTYEEIRLILDGENYVAFEDGTTQPLNIPSGTSSGYKIKGTFEVASDKMTKLVADIDLRKALVVEGQNDYKLRPTARVVEAENTGTIKGTVSAEEDRMVVYAYEKGSFSQSETNEPEEGATRFEGSVNSAVVTNGSFTLAFMEEGEYELIIASYNKAENQEGPDNEEGFRFESATRANFMLSGTLSNVVKVNANSSTSLILDLNL